MKPLKSLSFNGKKIEDILVVPFTFKHFKLLAKTEYHKFNEIRYKMTASLIGSVTFEDGSVLNDLNKIQEFVNNLDIVHINCILVEAKKFELEEKDGKLTISQLSKCENCKAPLNLDFDISEPLPIKELPDLEIDGYKVKFKLPTKKDEQYFLKNIETDSIEALFRMYVESINDEQNFDEIPFNIIKKINKHLDGNMDMGYVFDTEFTCHKCEHEFKSQLDTSISRFFE